MLLAFAGEPGERYDAIRQNLLCLTMGERDQETAAMACPVFGVEQKLEGALSVSGPLHRFTPEAIQAIQGHLLTSAARISTHFGGDSSVFTDRHSPTGI
ncbi:Bacterial transcriptional regulator [compost metagenome]